jgi:hypothetical protein
MKDSSTNDPNINHEQSDCESKVISSKHLGECESNCYPPYGRPGPIVIKVPVVLANCKIQIDIESEIRLDVPAFDVKTIDKQVCITQCHLVPHTNKLFLAGFVQKNIQYSTVECANKTSISGDVLHTTVRLPFKCVAAICFDKYPIFGKSAKEKSNVLDKSMLCPNNKEDSWIHFDKFSEPISCELEWTKILETDIFDRNIRHDAEPFTKEKLFQEITEKMVVYVGIKVLQNQQVYIAEPSCIINMEKDYDDKKEYEDIEIAYVHEKGIIGRMINGEKY